MSFYHILSRLFFIIALPAFAQQRTWVSADGQHRFEGEFIELKGDTAFLQNAEGAEVQVPLLRLDQESRNLALTLSLPPDTPGRRVLFSHFTDQYRLTLHNHHDMARIEFREAGQSTGYPPMILRVQHSEADDPRRIVRDFRAMDGAPRLEEDTLIWRARMRSQGIVEVRIRLLPDGIDYGYRIEFPDRHPNDPRLALVAVFPPVLEFDPHLQTLRGPLAPDGVDSDRIPTLLRPFTVQYRTLQNRIGTLSYTEIRERTVPDLSRIQFRGPYTRNPIHFHTPAGRDSGELTLWFYEGGRSLSQGARVRHLYPEFPETGEIPAWFQLRFE